MTINQTEPTVPGIDTSANSAVMIVHPTVLVDTSDNAVGVNGNPLYVTGGGGGTQYTDGAATPTTPTGSVILFDNSGTLVDVGVDHPLPISGSFSATNPSIGTDGSTIPTSSTLIGASDGTNLQQLRVENAGNPNLRVGVYQGANEATITQFHSTDNQSLGTGNGLLTGGVAQILNPGGLLDRQRGTGFDNIPAVGVATGTQQLAGSALTTTFNGAVTASGAAQSVAVASSANLKIGDMVQTQDNVEQTEITAIADSTHCTAIFKNNHASGQTLTWYHYNQARDATIGDQIGTTGVSPSATYLYNTVTGLLEYNRSADGERDGATGKGTEEAAEYEWNGGGPVTNAGIVSGLQFDRARNLQGKGLGSGTISNNPLAAGSTSLTLNSAPTTLMAGQQIIFDRAGANPEAGYVATNYTAGSTTVPLQSATAFSHAQNSTIEWDQFAGLGPQLTGFTPAGIGIEEEALYNPVDGKYYIERSATQDAMAGANVVAESPALWNGSTFDRLKGDNTGAARSSMYVKTTSAGDTALTVGQGTKANSLPVTLASDQGDLFVKGDFAEQASLSAGSLNADLVASTDVSAYKWLSLHTGSSAYSGTLSFQGSNDNSNWTSVELFAGNSLNNGATAITNNTNNIWHGPVYYRYLRIRMTSYTSGTANGTIELYTSPNWYVQNSFSATQSGTWTIQPGNTANTSPWLESIHDGTNKANVLAATSVSNAVGSQGALLTAGAFAEQASLSAGSLNADLVASTDISNYTWWSLHITAIASGGTLTFQGCNDNSSWVSILAYNANITGAPVSTTTTTGLYYAPRNYRYLRIRQTAWTSSSSTGVLELYTKSGQTITQSINANQSGTWTVQPGNTPNTTPWLESIHDGTNKANVLAATSVSNASTAQGALLTAGAFSEQASLTASSLNGDLVPSTDVSAYSWLSLQINTSAYVGTLQFQESNDGVNFVPRQMQTGDGTSSGTTTTAANLVYSGQRTARYFRVRMTAYTSGTAQGTFEGYTLSTAFSIIQARQTGTWSVGLTGGDVTAVTAAAYTTTQTQADQTNTAAKGIRVFLNVSSAGTGSITLEIDAKDVASGVYYAILTGIAVTSNSTNVYTVYPGLTPSANAIASDVLPRTWRVKVVANNANSVTYSVGTSYLL